MAIDPILAREWHPVAKAEDFVEGTIKSARVLGEDVVLWKSGADFVAWQDLCIHRGAKLSLGKVESGCLQCPYHGWIYDQTGACIKIPAHPGQVPPPRAHTRVYKVKELYGWVWVCLSDTPAPWPVFPEWDQAGVRVLGCGPYLVHAGGPRILENFLDVAHLPVVHAGTLGVMDRPEINRYMVEQVNGEIWARDIVVWQPDPDGSGQGAPAHYTYNVQRPLTAYLSKDAGDSRFTMMITASPVSETCTYAWVLISMRGAETTSSERLIEWTEKIFLEDVPIVESQKPERLPLDLQAELHLNSDRTSIAYRQWLNEIGLSFGTS